MSGTKGHEVVEKIEHLTETLTRTTGVLSTADRMIDHYRDLNNEQEFVIAKLREDLEHSKNGKKLHNDGEDILVQEHLESSYDGKRSGSKSYRDSKRKISHASSEFSSDENFDESNMRRRKTFHSPKVRFKDPKPEYDHNMESLKSSLSDVKKRQERLELDVKNNRRLRNEEMDRLDSSLRRQLSFDISDDKSLEMNESLSTIQHQIEKDQILYKKQQKDMENISEEMKLLKNVIESSSGKKKSENVIYEVDAVEQMSRKINIYKKRVAKQYENINLLKERLNQKEEEVKSCEITVRKMESLGEMKSDQLKSLEQQLSEEKRERHKILREYEETQKKLGEANKERSELLFHLSDLKAEVRSSKLTQEQTSHTVPELKSLLKECKREKEELSDEIRHLQGELQRNDGLNVKLKTQVSDYMKKIDSLKFEKEGLNTQLEEAKSKCYDIKNELESTKEMLIEMKQGYKGLEDSKRELKEKALNALKEYRSRYRKCEKQVKELSRQLKVKEFELSKVVSESNEQEIVNLKLKKEMQEAVEKMSELQEAFKERENKCNQLLYEKNQLEDALLQSSEQSKSNLILQREVSNLKKEKIGLDSQLSSEKRKRQEFQSLLHEYYEKNISAAEEQTLVKQKLEEEMNKLRKEHDNEMQKILLENEKDLLTCEDKIKELSNCNGSLKKKLHLSDETVKQAKEDYEHVKLKLIQQELETGNEVEKVKLLTIRVRKSADENKKIRKQFQQMKQNFYEKLKKIQVESNKEKNVLMEQDRNSAQTAENVGKESIDMVISILSKFINNLLNLLSHEEDNVPTLKEIPKSILVEHQKAVHSVQEKYETCYSITKTLKARFQQQKVLIRRAQEKIKSQMQHIHTMTNSHSNEILQYQQKISSFESEVKKEKERIVSLDAVKVRNEKTIAFQDTMNLQHEEKIKILEDSRKKSEELIAKKDREILVLRNQLSDLTRDLEGCTKALHKSLEVDRERNTVLKEIDLLKIEHEERQLIDENFFKCTGNIESLTEQLNAAKQSLSDIKQDSIDKTEITNNLIHTLGSISPVRKPRLFLYDSPLFKATPKSFFQNGAVVPSYMADLEGSPTQDHNNNEARHLQFTDMSVDSIPGYHSLNRSRTRNTNEPLQESICAEIDYN